MTRTIRTTLTFTFDDGDISEADIKDDLDQALTDTFPGRVVDVHTRWVSRLEEAPLFGAATRLRTDIGP